jgi:hypothetical protein
LWPVWLIGPLVRSSPERAQSAFGGHVSRPPGYRRTRRALRSTADQYSAKSRHLRPLRFEPLEERRLLAITVNTLVDELDGSIADGDISLRDAIAAAPAGETVDFDAAFTSGGPATMTLSLGELVINKPLTIVGPAADLLAIDANNGSRVFNVDDGTATAIDVEISRLTLTGGRVSGFSVGGAVRNAEDLTIRAAAISGNTASFMGGGIWNGFGNLTVVDSMISGNSASHGGGIFAGAASSTQNTTITNSTISGNMASVGGGGVFSFDGQAIIGHSTITNNMAPNGSAGGVASYANSTTQSRVHSTIIAGNTGGDVGLFGGNGTNSFDSDGYNLIGIGSGQAAFSNNDVTGVIDPLVGPLAANGGPTGTHALLAGSLAANAGDPAAAAGMNGVPEFDQRGEGFPRVVYGRIDIGAFEAPFVVGPTLVVDTLTDELDGNVDPGDLSLREAIGLANLDPDVQAITFAPALTMGGPATITLLFGEVEISASATITGSGPGLLAIQASAASRIFRIDDGTSNLIDVLLSGLTLTGGNQQGSGDGGAILNRENLAINHSVITGNRAVGGGGIYSRDGHLTITNSTLSGNTASLYGGGIFNTSGQLTIVGSTLSGNMANGGGGLVSDTNLTTHTTTITNSTLSGNTATVRGGGVLNLEGLTAIRHSTLTNNTAPDGSGSGVASYGNALARTEIHSTIIAGNTNSDVDFVTGMTNSLLSLGYNLVGSGNADGSFNQPGDQTSILQPQLLPLANNGGPTQTHALQLGSPAINAGDPAAAAGMNGVPEFDQRGEGFPRIVENRIDIGAFEVQQPQIVVGTLVDESDGDFSPGDLSLREAVEIGNSRSDAPGIAFAASLTGSGPATIMLALGELLVRRSLDIIGPGANRLTIQGNDSSRIFHVNDGAGDNLIDVSISGLTFTGGHGDPAGGAIFTVEKLAVDAATISDNSAELGGGIAGSGELTITNSTISGNSAHTGGGIHFAGMLTVTNSTISNNSAMLNGGGIFNEQNRAAVRHSTITNNTATSGGAGGVASNGTAAETIVYSTIIAGNGVPSGSGDVGFFGTMGNSFQSGGYNLIGAGNATAAFNQPGDHTGIANPLLGPLADNGGPTSTHALRVGSPAVDAGDPGATPGRAGVPVSDQRGSGFPRLEHGRIDIGAFEAEFDVGESLVVDTLADELDGNTAAGDVSLREALWLANLDSDVQTIQFAAALTSADPATIMLALGSLVVSKPLTISGPAANLLAIDAGGDSRVLTIDNGDNNDAIDIGISGLTLSGGKVTGFKYGGGILNRENLTITASTIAGNSSSFLGGGIWTGFGDLTITTSTISGNVASHGGGIFSSTNLNGQTTTITSSTISGNTATVSGGGLLNTQGLAVIHNSTIANNTAPAANGGGVSSYGNSATRTEVRSSIIAGNTNSDVDLFGDNATNSFQSGGYNLIGSGNALTAFANNDQTGIADPRLATLANNGGPTMTHALEAGSPAFNAGDPAAVAGMDGVSEFDQRGSGFPRIFDGRIDIGAFESQVIVPPLGGDYNQDAAVDIADFVIWRKAIGTMVPPFTGADGNGNGTIDQADYDVWRANFGRLLPPAVEAATAMVSAVPSVPAGLSASSAPDRPAYQVALRTGFLSGQTIRRRVIHASTRGPENTPTAGDDRLMAALRAAHTSDARHEKTVIVDDAYDFMASGDQDLKAVDIVFEQICNE